MDVNQMCECCYKKVFVIFILNGTYRGSGELDL